MRVSPIKALLAFLLLSLPLALAQEIATLTLVEGPLRVLRGTAVLQGAEGVRLHGGDILESAPGGFVQLEFVGGTVAALGPSTRVYLLHSAGSSKRGDASELVLLSGWLKGETSSNGGAYRYASPYLAATARDGAIVMDTAADGTDIFIESGSAGISKVSPAGNLDGPAPGKAGEFFARHVGKSVNIYPRPSSAFIDGMPRQFRDTLPSRLARFPKAAAPKRDHEVSYTEIQAWLTMPSAWRRGFVERFQPRLHGAAFRKDLEAHVKDHPEWDPILHPEKRSKIAPATAEDSDPEQRR